MGRIGLVAWACTGVLVALPACSGDDGSPDAGRTGASRAPSGTASGDASAGGAGTTEPGTVLDLGEQARVEWRASADLEGILDLRVDSVREADPADFDGLVAAGSVEGAQPYYVDVRVANAGDTDLGGLDVPLYLLDTSRSYGPPWGFAERFGPCPSGPLPEPFAAGDTADRCLVYFARAGAAYDAMAFQPVPDVAAITWTGAALGPARGDRGPSRRRR